MDIPWIINAPLPSDIKKKVEAPNVMGGGVVENGCADSSIYTRLPEIGLQDIQVFPQFITLPDMPNWESQARSVLSVNEAQIWDKALEESRAKGIFFISQPFHCAIGTKTT